MDVLKNEPYLTRILPATGAALLHCARFPVVRCILEDLGAAGRISVENLNGAVAGLTVWQRFSMQHWPKQVLGQLARGRR